MYDYKASHVTAAGMFYMLFIEINPPIILILIQPHVR